MSEIPKLDMTKEELQYTVSLLMNVPMEAFAKLTTETLIKMLKGLNDNAMAYNSLEDKYRALIQQDTYKPLNKKTHNARHVENRELGKQLREFKKKGLL